MGSEMCIRDSLRTEIDQLLIKKLDNSKFPETLIEPIRYIFLNKGKKVRSIILAESCALFDVKYTKNVLSAHRTPAEVLNLVNNAESSGIKVFIAAAGMAAHLAGVVAAHTTLPVIGIPIPSGSLNGMDSLLSTVQMPPGIPVATVAIGSSGAKNAAILAVQILATSDENLKQKLSDFKVNMKDEVLAKDAKLNS